MEPVGKCARSIGDRIQNKKGGSAERTDWVREAETNKIAKE